MRKRLSVISSMATRLLLMELLGQYEDASGVRVELESIGGVEASQQVRDGAHFDVAILSAGAISKLEDNAHIVAASQVALARSGVAVAVRAGAPRPDISSEEALRDAVVAAGAVGYSTGPSGVALAQLFESWGIAGAIADRIRIPPPGVPVGALLAAGEVELGFQQLSELMHLDGIDVIGPLPPAVQIETTFAGGICAASTRHDASADLLHYLISDGVADVIVRHGMAPAIEQSKTS